MGISFQKFILLVILIIGIAICFRVYTFIFPHDHGDQIIYAALTENINTGLPYNLSSVKLIQSKSGEISFIFFEPCNVSSQSIAGIFKKGGADIYGEKMFFRTPVFPLLCNFTRMVSGNKRVQLLALPRLRFSRFRNSFFKNWFHHQPFSNLIDIAYKQLPMTLPQFLGSIMIVIGTIVLARKFSNITALWAGLIIAFCPIDIFTASRVLTDSVMSACILWCFIFLKKANDSQKYKILFLLIAFTTAVIAVYTKESAVLIIFAASAVMAYKNKGKKVYLALAVLAIISIIPWMIALHSANGQWIPKAYWQSLATAQWYKITSQREFFFYFYKPFMLYPVLILAIVYFINIFQKKMWWQNIFFTLPAVTLIIMTLLRVSEFRQILAALPFLAIASACGLEILRKKIDQKFQPVAGIVIVLFIIIFSAVFAFQQCSLSLFGNAGDIFI